MAEAPPHAPRAVLAAGAEAVAAPLVAIRGVPAVDAPDDLVVAAYATAVAVDLVITVPLASPARRVAAGPPPAPGLAVATTDGREVSTCALARPVTSPRRGHAPPTTLAREGRPDVAPGVGPVPSGAKLPGLQAPVLPLTDGLAPALGPPGVETPMLIVAAPARPARPGPPALALPQGGAAMPW